LKNIFNTNETDVTSDILAATPSLFLNNSGIGIILEIFVYLIVLKLLLRDLEWGNEGCRIHIEELLIQDYLNSFTPNIEKEFLESNYDLDRL
jgi:hypothetical protein